MKKKFRVVILDQANAAEQYSSLTKDSETLYIVSPNDTDRVALYYGTKPIINEADWINYAFLRKVHPYTLTAEDFENDDIEIPKGAEVGNTGLLFTIDADDSDDGNEKKVFINLEGYQTKIAEDEHSLYYTEEGLNVKKTVGEYMSAEPKNDILVTEETLQAVLNRFEVDLKEFIDNNYTAYTFNPATEISDTASLIALVTQANENGDDVSVKLSDDINLTGSGNVIRIPDGINANIEIAKDVTLSADKNSIYVGKDSVLTLTGEGTITANNKTTSNSSPCIYMDEGSTVVFDGPTIEIDEGFGYGFSAGDGTTLNIKSGTIHTSGGCGIGNNNTEIVNLPTNINISGGEILCDISYAIYMAGNCNLTITGGKVQGIMFRMGNLIIGGNAEIIPGTFKDGIDPVGQYHSYSGCAWLGDTVAIMAGTYNPKEGLDTNINVSIMNSAKISSNTRNAVGIYMSDVNTSGTAATVTVNIANSTTISTTDENADGVIVSDGVAVYDHTYINEKSTAEGATYNPTCTSTVTVHKGSEVIYPTA